MKKAAVSLTGIVALMVFFAVNAFSFEPPAGPPQFAQMKGQDMHMGPPMMPPGMKLLTDCIQIDVISSLTGLTQENVKQLLISSQPPAILEAYGVSDDALRNAMDESFTKLINQAGATGLISQKQSEEILKKLVGKDMKPCLKK